MAAPVHDDYKKTVAFIYVTDKGKLLPNGTSFFVSVRNEVNPNNIFIYLVTSKHVLQNSNTKQWLNKIFLRLNQSTGSSEYSEIPIITHGDDKTVYTPADETVDLAVIPILPDVQTTDFKVIPSDLIINKEEFKEHAISEGTEVYFIGLLTHHTGKTRLQPVVRFGRVALIPDENVHINGMEMDLYLIESFSFGGNSGSPVFFYLGPDSKPGVFAIGGEKTFLAGVMMGAFIDFQPLQFLQTANGPFTTSNIGISLVVPSYKIKELLYSDELKGLREMINSKNKSTSSS